MKCNSSGQFPLFGEKRKINHRLQRIYLQIIHLIIDFLPGYYKSDTINLILQIRLPVLERQRRKTFCYSSNQIELKPLDITNRTIYTQKDDEKADRNQQFGHEEWHGCERPGISLSLTCPRLVPERLATHRNQWGQIKVQNTFFLSSQNNKEKTC